MISMTPLVAGAAADRAAGRSAEAEQAADTAAQRQPGTAAAGAHTMTSAWAHKLYLTRERKLFRYHVTSILQPGSDVLCSAHCATQAVSAAVPEHMHT